MAQSQYPGLGWPVLAQARRPASVAVMRHQRGVLAMIALTVTGQGCELSQSGSVWCVGRTELGVRAEAKARNFVGSIHGMAVPLPLAQISSCFSGPHRDGGFQRSPPLMLVLPISSATPIQPTVVVSGLSGRDLHPTQPVSHNLVVRSVGWLLPALYARTLLQAQSLPGPDFNPIIPEASPHVSRLAIPTASLLPASL